MNTWALLKPFGIDIFCTGKKFLVFNLVGRNLKVKYRRSVLGVAWTLLSPLATALIFYFVFKVIMKVQIPHYMAFLVSGVLPWAFFSQTITEGLDSVVGNSGIAGKVPVPVQIFPYVGAITNFVTLFLALPVILGVSVFTDVPLSGSVIYLPYFFLCLFFMSYGLSLILGMLFIYFRDLKHAIGLVIQLWFYGTPVFYNPNMVPPKYHWILWANPTSGVFVGLHDVLAYGQWPGIESIVSSGAWAFAIMAAGLFVFKATYQEAIENL
jgi:ABC-type polysaccharide/polyol phosphate export permease